MDPRVAVTNMIIVPQLLEIETKEETVVPIKGPYMLNRHQHGSAVPQVVLPMREADFPAQDVQCSGKVLL